MNFKNFLELPVEEIEGTIKEIKDKNNPIIIKINNGTPNGKDIALTPAEYRRYKNIYNIDAKTDGRYNKKIKAYIQKFEPYKVSQITIQ
jgi:hypothetical protein